jgi:ATP-binding cassette subfamily C protein CydC
MSRRTVSIRDLLGEPPTGRRLTMPAALTVVAFGLGVGLLGLAGWFIAACAVAGLATTSTFSFLFPSAGVQALAWARTLGRYGERITTHHATLDLVGALRTSLFARALHLPRGRAAELRSSELLGRIMVDSDAVENLLLRGSFPTLAAVAALVGAAALFSWLSFILALVAVAGLSLTAGVLILLAHHQAGRPARRLVDARADARRRLIETLDGLPELRSFGAEERAAADVARQLERLARSRRRLSGLTAGGQSIGTLLADLTLLALVATAAGLLGAGTLSAPAFVAACLVAIAVFEPIVALPAAITARAKARAAANRLTEAFPGSTPKTATEPAPSRPWPLTIAVKDHDIHFALKHGDTLLLTGASGTGKSTLLRAIAGQPTLASMCASPASMRRASTRSSSPGTRRWSPRTPMSSTARSATTSGSRHPPPRRTSSGERSPRPRSRTRWPPSLRGWTLLSAPAATRSQVASAAASASPRHCSGAGNCCCSTSRPRASTSPPPLGCSPACAPSTPMPRS